MFVRYCSPARARWFPLTPLLIGGYFTEMPPAFGVPQRCKRCGETKGRQATRVTLACVQATRKYQSSLMTKSCLWPTMSCRMVGAIVVAVSTLACTWSPMEPGAPG